MIDADALTHMIRQVVGQQMQGNRSFAYGHIASYDNTLHRVRVTFPAQRDEEGDEVLSPWMPLNSVWVGSGFGLQAAPVGGEQCVVELIESQHGVHVCASLYYNQQSLPPGGVAAGEAIMKHKSGSFLKFHANGDVETNASGNVNITAASGVNVTATTEVTVDAPVINLGATGEGLLDALTSAAATLYNTHTHGGVLSGGSHTAVPDQLMGAGQMTSVVKVG